MNIIDLYEEKKPIIMGIVNVTPDSFSDGGDNYSVDNAINHGLALLEQGADILDIGGESTRPNADTVSVNDEIRRVIPVIKGLKDRAKFISIDTRNSLTMKAAIDAGANIINDVSGLFHDSDSINVVAHSGVPICIMHMKGNPKDMQDKPEYNSIINDICNFFEERIRFCKQNGISQDKIILDPGIGFGKTLEHNLLILNNIQEFTQFDCKIMLGASRKSFIGVISGEEEPKERLGGSIATAIYGLEQGVCVFRVHDVKETKQAFDVYNAIKTS